MLTIRKGWLIQSPVVQTKFPLIGSIDREGQLAIHHSIDFIQHTISVINMETWGPKRKVLNLLLICFRVKLWQNINDGPSSIYHAFCSCHANLWYLVCIDTIQTKQFGIDYTMTLKPTTGRWRISDLLKRKFQFKTQLIRAIIFWKLRSSYLHWKER